MGQNFIFRDSYKQMANELKVSKEMKNELILEIVRYGTFEMKNNVSEGIKESYDIICALIDDDKNLLKSVLYGR
jgi:hypothetical protein